MRENLEQRAEELAVFILESLHHPRHGKALRRVQINGNTMYSTERLEQVNRPLWMQVKKILALEQGRA